MNDRSILRRAMLRAGLGLAAGSARPRAVLAQEWPARTIRWLVPYQPGSAPDNTVRIVADALGDVLRQPVIAENKAGAGGSIGAQLAARAPADGYTWVYSATPMAAAMKLHRAPGFDAMKDFVHVARISASDVLLVVHADSGIRSVADLLERARKAPGTLSYASGGIGTPSHLGAELLLAQADLDVVHVPYKGAVDAVNGVLTRQVAFSLPIFSVAMPQVRDGRLRALAVAGPKRNPKLPDVPTLAEAGVTGVSLVSYGGVSVPARTPAPVIARIGDAIRIALERPEVRAKLEANGGIVSYAASERYTEDLRAELVQVEKMMKAAKVEPQ